MTLKLHVGCGTKKLEGYVNCDIAKDVNPDVVVDICALSKKFKKKSVDEILTEHMLEHVDDFVKAMKEIHAVLKKGGKAHIVVPYATIPSAFHPHHKWYFTKESFSPFHKDNSLRYYYDFHFSSVKTKIVFSRQMFFMTKLANKMTWLYENSGLAWLFPAKELHVELTK
ncbi:MAG: methyltransferase domain-containing protein [Candidatus Aenigmarchaeota archaeon]|nr:methyltransferase domain-containing protein [Candidatus Aenigmarchaeota archaeon]